MTAEQLCESIEAQGAYKTGVVPVGAIVFDAQFRKLCESNSCGKYGRCWMCPPDVGDIDTLIAAAKYFDSALVYQSIGQLEDSYDFEGMMEAAKQHGTLSQAVHRLLDTGSPFAEVLHLSAGGCHICNVCAKQTNELCRYPKLATAGLETYGIDVSQLAKAAGMQYINGPNTVTYFSAILYKGLL